MNISEIGISGFKSFGNNEQILKLNTERGELILLCGKNGNGKCVDESTSINVMFNEVELININYELPKNISENIGREIIITIGELYELSKNIDILKSDIKVETPNGMRNIFAVDVTAKDSDIYLIRAGKFELLCSPNHKIKSNGNWIDTINIKIGDIIDTKYGSVNIESIDLMDYKKDLLDLHVDGNEYYTNDILSHNSSLINSFEYTLFGKVRGRKRKYATLSTLPNRINGSLLNRIKFKSGSNEIEIKRGISPGKLELWENGIENTRAGKGNIDTKIEEYIGFDIETFNSFISMSINDFKNFTSLSNEEKQLLLDKLFNLEIINILNDILKQLVKNNKTDIQRHDLEISTINDSIQSIKNSIEKHKKKEEENFTSEIEKVKSELEQNKEPYKKLKEKKDKIKDKDSELKRLIDSEKENYYKTSNDIKNIEKELGLYEKGKCPTCSNDFNNDYYSNLKDALNIKKEDTNKILDEINKNISNLNDKVKKLKQISNETDELFNKISLTLRELKNRLDFLNSKLENSKSDNTNIEEFLNSITELEDKSNKSSEKLNELSDNEVLYKEISKIFSDNGVKKTIIQSIIKPLNMYLEENIKEMGLNFRVELDESFNAKITTLNNEIDHDTLSTGESKLININILIAYLKLIRTKKNINILFLDEVFSSIDLENISKILILLKHFATQYNVNIFVVHHAVMNQELFDRIIKLEKDVFSYIEEVDITTI